VDPVQAERVEQTGEEGGVSDGIRRNFGGREGGVAVTWQVNED
jgi:hypothetical protein